MRVWDPDSGEPVLGPLIGHHGDVRAVAVGERQGGPVIVSGAYDGTVRVRNLEAESNATLRIKLEHQVGSIAVIANRLVIGTRAELLRLDLP